MRVFHMEVMSFISWNRQDFDIDTEGRIFRANDR